ncbi:MAG TPA: hypothetical protein VEU96_04420 [Bryobacteraceae bacterium]|nr:hypothetical protein [Bryobacteraceae bacterium]
MSRLHLVVAFGFAAILGNGASVQVLTANYDNERTNANLKETVLKPANVGKDTFGKIGSFPVDGQIYAQPLYVAGVQISGKGARNVVYVATMHNSVYAIDADTPGSITPLWRVNLGPSVPSSVLDFSDILPEVGILSTPVIDPNRQVMYVVSDTMQGGAPVFRLHALSLADGREMLNGPVKIAASVAGEGMGSDNGTLPFAASEQLQRPGLVLANGKVYVAFGSHGDGGNFHGWMIAYDASDLRRLAVFNSTPNTWGGSFWQAGRAPAVDRDGNLYASTGNGEFDGAYEFGDSVLKLSGKDLSLMDWYTPDNFQELIDSDSDLGSAGVILLPGANRLLTAGKAGDLMMVNGTSLGHLGPMNSATAQTVRASDAGVYNFALWNHAGGPMLYVQEPWGDLLAFRINDGRLEDTVTSRSAHRTDTLFAGVAVSADDTTEGTAIVWEITADYNARQIPGTVHAFDATDLSRELWSSDMVPARDTLGRFAKFVAPTVVNGRVYVPTFSGQLAIYGLLSDASPKTAAPDVQVTSVVNGASLMGDAVAPGEVVTIYGANMGPVMSASMQMSPNGQAASLLEDTLVTFDGIPAPLIYTSSAEVGAVAPFGIAGPATEVVVTYRGQSSPAYRMPVAPAAPALFSQDGTGGGQGAILNEDGTENSFEHTAAPGSVVTLYGTGLGQTTPAGEDGKVAGALPLPTPVLPVTVLIDGQLAEVIYAGAAPGMLQGFAQINVRIPAAVTPAYDLQVVVKVGAYASPAVITINVQ